MPDSTDLALPMFKVCTNCIRDACNCQSLSLHIRPSFRSIMEAASCIIDHLASVKVDPRGSNRSRDTLKVHVVAIILANDVAEGLVLLDFLSEFVLIEAVLVLVQGVLEEHLFVSGQVKDASMHTLLLGRIH